MLHKARSVDFVLTPSERDALVLESNLIKHHQPPYNVLLKGKAYASLPSLTQGSDFVIFCRTYSYTISDVIFYR